MHERQSVLLLLSRYLCIYLESCVESRLSSDALVQRCPTLHQTAPQYNHSLLGATTPLWWSEDQLR